MKKLNLLLCATTVLSCASTFCMLSDKIEYKKDGGISVRKIEPVQTSANLRADFIKIYGMTPEAFASSALINKNLQAKYADIAIKKMDRFKNIQDLAERQGKMLGKIVRKNMKSGDLYVGIAKKDQRSHYNNYKKEILLILPQMKIDKKYVRFSRYGYTGNPKTEKKESSKPARTKRTKAKKTVVKKPVAKELVEVTTVRTMTAKPTLCQPAKQPMIIEEKKVSVWEVQKPVAKPMPVKQAPRLIAPKAEVAQEDSEQEDENANLIVQDEDQDSESESLQVADDFPSPQWEDNKVAQDDDQDEAEYKFAQEGSEGEDDDATANLVAQEDEDLNASVEDEEEQENVE